MFMSFSPGIKAQQTKPKPPCLPPLMLLQYTNETAIYPSLCYVQIPLGTLMCMQSPSKCMQTNTSLDFTRACCQKFVDEVKHIVDFMNVHWFKQSNGYKCFNTYFYFFIFFIHVLSCKLQSISFYRIQNSYFSHYESHFRWTPIQHLN
jgi:hypothetical protein